MVFKKCIMKMENLKNNISIKMVVNMVILNFMMKMDKFGVIPIGKTANKLL